MNSVIDVSGAIEILFQKEKSKKFCKALENTELITAPDLYICELTNTLWKYYKAKILSHDECIKFIQDGINLVEYFFPCIEMWQEALSEGISCGHSIYDMYYMITARRNGAVLITNDSELASICRKNNVKICC